MLTAAFPSLSHNGPGAAVAELHPVCPSSPSMTTHVEVSEAEFLGHDHHVPLLSTSSDEDEGEVQSLMDDPNGRDDKWAPLPVRGVLSKWTNLLHGWQERFFVLSDGCLTYYRNADDVGLGSRGSVKIRSAFVKGHEYDDCRFEVRVGELIWYLRCVNTTERQNWMAAIDRHRVVESGYGSNCTLHRPRSLLSLNSTNHSPSISSSSSFRCTRRLRTKLAEMETFKEILCKQVDSLQTYFDACSSMIQNGTQDHLEDWLKRDSDEPNNSDELESLSDDRTSQNSSERKIPITSLADSGSDRGRHSPESDLMISPSRIMKPVRFEQDSTTVVQLSMIDSQSDVRQCSAPTSDGNQPPSSTPPIFPTEVQLQIRQQGGVGNFLARLLPFRNTSSVPPQPQIPTPSSFVLQEEQQDAPPSDYMTTPTMQLSDLRQFVKRHGAYAPDFRGESHMFKATTAGILTNLSHTIELMSQHEDRWRKRLEREFERRRRLEETQRAMAQELIQLRHMIGMNAINSSLLSTRSSSNQAAPGSPRRLGHARLHSCGVIDFRPNQNLPNVPPSSMIPPDFHSPKLKPSNRTLFNLVGPDFEEGPNSVIREEEFYDAIDAESDRIEQDAARLAALRSAGRLLRSAEAMPTNHPLHDQMEAAVADQIRNFANPRAFDKPGQDRTSDVGNDESTTAPGDMAMDWKVIVQDNEMIIYQRELETEDGVVLDPLQAVHTVHGVTAREMCSYFWDVEYRMDWEFTIDQAPRVIEVCGDDTVVLYQVYKRVWPTTQRDSLFWSHIRQVTTASTDLPNRPLTNDGLVVLDSWMVVNRSTDFLKDKVTASSTPMIRLGLDVVLYCQTVTDSHSVQLDTIPRDRLWTRLVYMANINPGGWVPVAGLRTLARREYPRFLRRFSAYVQEQTRDKSAFF